MQEVELRTGVWYHDRAIRLTFPESWDVKTYWPETPLPLTEQEIRAQINLPVGQPPLRELAKGKRRPVVVIDDLARPTPVFRIMPYLLEEFRSAGISPGEVQILVATGTHGDQDREALRNKIGREAFEGCRLVIHNDQQGTKWVGKTSFGTPVFVNRTVLEGDLIVGVGGVYPQHTTGFGGGGKLALGILGRKSITHLHFSHKGVAGTYNIDNNFRKDLTEIARMIGLNTIFTLHTNAQLELVHLLCGDHFSYYPEAAAFSKVKYTAPLPDDADVVIVNTYPSDISYTFARKAMKPIRCAPPHATRILIGSIHEGIGRHGLFQQGVSEKIKAYKALYRRISVMEPRVIFSKIVKNLFFRRGGRSAQANIPATSSAPPERLWLYRPKGPTAPIQSLPGLSVVREWEEILEVIHLEYPGKERLKVRIYPCGSLQCLDAEVAHDGGGD